MKITSTKIKDIFIIEPEIYSDNRGYFIESFNQLKFKKSFPHINFCQDNESKSSFGVLRGLHYQLPPKAQTKLVRVIKGEVLDIAVDIRENSPTFGDYISVLLSDKNKKQLLIPRGFAHGFLVLSQEAIFSYKVDNHYDKILDRGIVYNDTKLAIDWKLKTSDIKLSEKDLNLPKFKNAQIFKFSEQLYD